MKRLLEHDEFFLVTFAFIIMGSLLIFALFSVIEKEQVHLERMKCLEVYESVGSAPPLCDKLLNNKGKDD